MNQTLQTDKSPPFKIVFLHFSLGALFFFVFSVGLLFEHSILPGRFLDFRVLSILHAFTLGWVCLTVFGALYQFIPVLSGRSWSANQWVWFTLILWVNGIIGFVISFWFHQIQWVWIFAFLLWIAGAVFSFRLWRHIGKGESLQPEILAVSVAFFWFLVVISIGFIMAIQFVYPVMNAEILRLLKLHAHLGALGFLLLLIFGVSSRLFPMFLLSHGYSDLGFRLSLLSIHGILIALVLQFLGFHWALWLSCGFFVLTAVFYGSFVFSVWKNRFRRKLEIQILQVFLGFGWFILAFLLIGLSETLGMNFVDRSQIWTAYGFAGLFGGVSNILMGFANKIVPFLIWLSKSGKTGASFLPADVFSHRLLQAEFIALNLGITGVVAGILAGYNGILLFGKTFILISSVLLVASVFSGGFRKLQGGNP